MIEVRFNSSWDGFDIASDRLKDTLDYFEDRIAIVGNHNFVPMGSTTARDIINGEYYDEDLAKTVGSGYGYKVTEELNKIMGGDWKYGQLTGDCQGDWQNMYYDAEVVDDQTIDFIDSFYMNKGTELRVYYDDEYQYSDYIPLAPWELTKEKVSGWLCEDIDKLVEYENKIISVAKKEID